MRKTIAIIATLAVSSAPAHAQGLADLSTIFGPQYANFKIGTGATEKTVSQFSFPIAFILPITDKLGMDISTAYANSRVSTNGVESSKISGLTDTQIRVNYTVGENRAVLTLGINAPTGMYKVPDKQQEAAGQIGSQFLGYPISSMGSGSAVTGGVAMAWTVGEWNVGLGGSYRYSSPFDAFQVQTNVLRFEPGSEGRLRLGLDRAIGDGRISLGGTFSAFSDDKVDSTSFATGARTLGQASIYYPTSFGDVSVGAWDLYRASGQQVGANAPWENIANVNVALGFNMGDVYVQPSLEGRTWMRDFDKAGSLGTGGVRLRFSMGSLSVNPSVSYSIGNVYAPGSTTAIDVTGLRGTLLIRLR
jgi:hypothetical protein